MADKKLSVLVTGALGFVGSATIAELANQGHYVAGIDNQQYKGINNFRYKSLPIISKFNGPMADWDICKSFPVPYKFDAIIHLAAIPGVRDSINDPIKYYQNNLMGTLNILELMREYKIPKLVFASTSSVYDWNNAPYKPISEKTQYVKPGNPYSGSKLACEDLCRIYHELHGISVSILRFFTVYGPAGRPDMFPLRCVKWVCEGETIQLNGDGSQERDFTYIDDVVDANIRAMNHESGFEVFNIGAGQPHSLIELIGIVNMEAKDIIPIEYNPSNNLDAPFTWADNSKVREILKWEPRVSFYDGVERTVEWYKQNREALQGIEF